ncbi:hypothetical protein ACQY0O_005526 [Thecaphora frezii]
MRLFHLCVLTLLVGAAMVHAIPLFKTKTWLERLLAEENFKVSDELTPKELKSLRETRKELNAVFSRGKPFDFFELPEVVRITKVLKRQEEQLNLVHRHLNVAFRTLEEGEPTEAQEAVSGATKQLESVKKNLASQGKPIKVLKGNIPRLVNINPNLFPEPDHRILLEMFLNNYKGGFLTLKKNYSGLWKWLQELAEKNNEVNQNLETSFIEEYGPYISDSD